MHQGNVVAQGLQLIHIMDLLVRIPPFPVRGVDEMGSTLRTTASIDKIIRLEILLQAITHIAGLLHPILHHHTPIVMDIKDTVNHTKTIAFLHLDLVVPFLMEEVVSAAPSVTLLSHEVGQGLPVPLRLAPHQKILHHCLHLQNPDRTEKHIKTSPIIKL